MRRILALSRNREANDLYVPEHFRETRIEVLRAFVERYSLATLVAMTSEGITANHIPMQWLAAPDDGTGLLKNGRPPNGMGLRIMAYRASMIGATFEIESLPECGTRVTCTLPAATINSTEANGAKK